jgi:hypothetical protein
MMQRRQVIKNIALMVGGSLSLPTLLAMKQKEKGNFNTLEFSLSDPQRQIIADVAELIIPKTDTAGAIEAGVPAFIEMMLKDCYQSPEHQSFKEGLADLQEKGFLNKNTADRIKILKEVEQENKKLMKVYNVQQTKMGDNEDKELISSQKKGLPFWRLIKELTLLGYFTSEVGISSSFDYTPIPGKLELIKLKPNQKLFAY